MPFASGNDEFCDASALAPYGSVLYVAVDAYAPFAGVTLMCTVISGDSTTDTPTAAPVDDTGVVWLQSGVPQTGLSGSNEDTLYFAVALEDSTSSFESIECVLSGDTGDSDLFTKWDAPVNLEDVGDNTVSAYRTSKINKRKSVENSLYPISPCWLRLLQLF